MQSEEEKELQVIAVTGFEEGPSLMSRGRSTGD
jgi:hypothetical protein